MASIRRLPGQVPPKPRRSLPWGRLALGMLVLLGTFYAAAWWRAAKLVDAEFERWSHLVTIERGTVELGPTGRIGVRGLVVRAAGSPPDAARVRVGRVVVDFGGGFGLFGRLLAGTVGPGSDSFRATFARLTMEPAAGAAPLGLIDRWVLFPFDLAGCGDGAPVSLDSLSGLSGTAIDGELVVDRKGDGAELRLQATSHAIADMSAEIRLDEIGAGNWANALRRARLRGARFGIVDHGFAALRNQHCASLLGRGPGAAVDRHVAAVREWFAKHHAEPAAPLLAVYRRLAERGGALEVNLRPRRPLPLAEFADLPLRDFSLHFGGTARVDGLVPATLALTPTALPEREPASVAAVVDAPLVALSAAAEVAGAKPDAVPAQIQFRPGQTLDYENLEKIPGASLAVTSTLGVTRRGRLVRYTRAGIELELDAADGGFRLSMPRDTITRIVLIANPPLDAASPSGRN